MAVLVGVNAFFVAAEFAFVAVDRVAIERKATAGHRRASGLLAALRRLSFHLSGAQLGITVSSLVIGFVAEPTLAAALEGPLGSVLGEATAGTVAIIVALTLATVGQMVVGELVPKNLAIAAPEPVALGLAPSMRAYGWVFGPLIRFLNAAADATVRAMGIEPTEELSSVRSLGELELLFASSAERGLLGPQESDLLARSVRFGAKTADDVMVPRVDLVTLDDDSRVADLLALARSTGHSRFPVARDGDLDEVVGIAHVAATLGVDEEAHATTAVTTIARPAFTVPESRPLDELLGDLRDQGHHLAVVADEYGGTAGLVTLEDLLEELVGEIADEHDSHEPFRSTIPRHGVHVVSGSLNLDEVADICGLRLPDGEYETLAGFVLDRLGRIPGAGARVDVDGWRIDVVHMVRHRIDRLRVHAPVHEHGPEPGSEEPS